MNTGKRISRRTLIIITAAAILVVALILTAIFLVGLNSGTRISDLTAKLSEIVGTVEIKKSAQDQYTPVDNGYQMSTAMQLQTQTDSRVRLDLSTGSIVRVGPSTIFSLGSQNSSSTGVLSQLELQAGKIWVVLNGGSLDVTTPSGVASVRGSYMFVWIIPGTNSTEVCCLEGVCQYSNAGGIVNLSSGQKVISTDSNTLPAIQKMDQSDVQLWLDNVPEAESIVPQVESLIATSTPTEAAAVATLTPTFTPTITPSPTLSTPMVSVSADTNCRVGPSTVYDALGILKVGESAQVVGRSAASDYWVIQLPSNPTTVCWIWGNYATVTGNTSDIPVIAPPPTPTPTDTPTYTATPTDTVTPSPTPTSTEYIGY